MKILIFIHIPKNGGNTFKRILEQNFDERTIFSVEVINHVTDNLDEFMALPEEKKEEIRLLRGHIRFGLHEHFNQETEYVTFLRNPLERVLSFYNFVPSCYSCNSKLKGTEEFSNLSPSSLNFDFHKKVKFKLFLDESCKDLNIKLKDNINISLKENYSDEYEKYIEVFKLNERYKAHKDIVYEMIENAKHYPESRLKELQDLTGIPYQQIKKDIFNLIDEDMDLSKKPFSKLIKDISHELGLI